MFCKKLENAYIEMSYDNWVTRVSPNIQHNTHTGIQKIFKCHITLTPNTL